MRYPDNPPHDRPGQNDVADYPVTETATSDAQSRRRLRQRPKPTTPHSYLTGVSSSVARQKPSAG